MNSYCYVCGQNLPSNSNALSIPVKFLGSEEVTIITSCAHHNGVQELHAKTVVPNQTPVGNE